MFIIIPAHFKAGTLTLQGLKGSNWDKAASDGTDPGADVEGVAGATAILRLVARPHHRFYEALGLRHSEWLRY